MTTGTSEAVRYTIAICKGSALLEETKTLLRAWSATESPKQFSERVLREDLLGRMTAYRARDIVIRVFAKRYLRPSQAPAMLLKRLLERNHSRQLFSDLCFLYAARADDLIRDTVTQLYWPALTSGRLTLHPEYVVEFLRQAEREGKIPEPWSEKVKLKVARGLLKAMADFGLLVETGRGRRELVHFRPTDHALVFLAYDLHFSGSTDAGIVGHKDWALFGLTAKDVALVLDRLGGERWWLAQVAGSIVRISWNYNRMEEVVDAFAG